MEEQIVVVDLPEDRLAVFSNEPKSCSPCGSLSSVKSLNVPTGSRMAACSFGCRAPWAGLSCPQPSACARRLIAGQHRFRCRALAAVALSLQTGAGPPPHSQIRGHRSQDLAQERAWPEVGAGAKGSGARVGAAGLAPLPDICARHRARNWGHVCPSIFPAALAASHWSPHPLTTLRASAAVEQDR